MKTHYAVGLGMLAGLALGVAAMQGLHAAANPPVYYIVEIDVTNPDAYLKEYAPKAQASIKAQGGRIVAAGEKVTPIEGTPPRGRVAIVVWDSLDQIKAWIASDQFEKDRKIGDKYATFRSFAVEGLPQ